MLAALVVVALVAVALAVATVLARRALRSVRAELATARAAAVDAEASRDRAAVERDEAQARLSEVQAGLDDHRRSAAEEAAAAAQVLAATEAEREAAEQARIEAEAAFSEAAVLAALLVDDGAADPTALWALECRRSERTWRLNVMAVDGDPSPLVGARHPLWTALEIEAASVREEIGTVIDLDIDLPDDLSPGASLATLRAAQELLAVAAPHGEEVVLRVATDGDDLVVTAEAIEADGTSVPLDPLLLPPSRFEPGPGSVRLRAVLAAPEQPDPDRSAG